MLEQGTTLQDSYRIVRVLGGGGMGQVYLVMDYVEGLQITSLTVEYNKLTIDLEPRR
jgi:serine/threonine protein kinase